MGVSFREAVTWPALLTASLFSLTPVDAADAQAPLSPLPPGLPELALPQEREGEPLEFVPESPAPSPILPPAPTPRPAERGLPSAVVQVFAREFRITGNTLFSDKELARVTDSYTDRVISSEELLAVQEALTRYYVDRGYVNSGAAIPDQKIEEGSIEIHIVEGRLTGVEIEGNRWFRARYLRDRLDPGTDRPLQLADLEERLQLLQRDRRIRSVHAELVPGALRGQGVLRVRIQEERPYRAWLEFSNHEAPSVGAERGRIFVAYDNVTGNGDVASARYGITKGLQDIEAVYAVPISRRDTRLEFRYRFSDSEVVEKPFNAIDVESRSMTAGVTLKHAIHRTLNTDFTLGLTGEWRQSRTFLLGSGFSFSEGADDGRSQVSVLRLFQEWTYRGRLQVLAARSTLSVGLAVLGASDQHGTDEDGEFVAWLGQFQWARRFDPWGVELLLRTDVQLAFDPLLSLERFSVGGSSSVRGYRENRLVRDNGFASSLEARIAIWRASDGASIVQLAPFVDLGRSWNRERGPTPGPKTLLGAGVGLRFSITRRLRGEIYWARQLRDVAEPSDRGLQDAGVHLRIFARVF